MAHLAQCEVVSISTDRAMEDEIMIQCQDVLYHNFAARLSNSLVVLRSGVLLLTISSFTLLARKMAQRYLLSG